MALLALWQGAKTTEELLKKRPQRQWFHLIDNFEMYFVPKLPRKHHAVVPLSVHLKAAQTLKFRDIERGLRHKTHRRQSRKPRISYEEFVQLEGSRILPNPYESEIQCLTVNPLPTRLLPPAEPKNLTETSLTLIASLADLQAFIDEINTQGSLSLGMALKECTDSYRGFTSVILISSNLKDYIIDPYRIYSYIYKLNELTANPNILKVFFDAPDQILNLQRDFSVYVINCFDAALAHRVLQPHRNDSLRSLVAAYVGKQITETDAAAWTQRPLTQGLMELGRQETHFLPFIASCLRNRLAASASSDDPCPIEIAKTPQGHLPKSGGLALLAAVDADSRTSCLQVYTFPRYSPSGEAARILKRDGIHLREPILHVLTQLLQWRDLRARIADVQRTAVKPDAVLLQRASAACFTHSSLSPLDELDFLARDSLLACKMKMTAATSRYEAYRYGADTTRPNSPNY